MAVTVYSGGKWFDQNPALTGPMDHAFWLGSSVFDGARAFKGYAPDLDRHCERLIRSARALLLEPKLTAKEVEALCVEGIRRFPAEAELYVKPMFFPRDGFVSPDPASTEFTLAVYDLPMPEPTGFSVCVTGHRRPSPDQAPTDAKASCLYPISARALKAAAERGFDNAIMLTPEGSVAELTSANLWIAKGGVAKTPKPNGTFLAGVTRRRVLELLRGIGQAVEETTLSVEDVLNADEVFSTGNWGKVMPITRVEDRHFQPGPLAAKARQLYFDFAYSTEKLL
jgi:branched-chain amino acid aminotransferase